MSSSIKTLRQYENIVLKGVNETGTTSQSVQVISGSRLIATLSVSGIDLGANITVNVKNGFQIDSLSTLGSLTLSSVDRVKGVFSDFYNQFEFEVVITGGNATYTIGIAVHDNASITTIENAEVQVLLSDRDDTGTGRFDAVRIGDGVEYIGVNPDQSINVVLVEPSDSDVINVYDESLAVAISVPADIITYTIPEDKIGYLYRVETSGENIAKYQILVNDSPIATRRTHHGSGLTTVFDFTTVNKKTVILQPSDIIKVTVVHTRPNIGDFEARMQVMLKALS